LSVDIRGDGLTAAQKIVYPYTTLFAGHPSCTARMMIIRFSKTLWNTDYMHPGKAFGGVVRQHLSLVMIWVETLVVYMLIVSSLIHPSDPSCIS
jgi:hypothetical protein